MRLAGICIQERSIAFGTKEHTRRRRTLRCSLCGLEITEGEDYWYCNGSSVCGACLPVFARAELAPFRQVRGREAAP